MTLTVAIDSMRDADQIRDAVCKSLAHAETSALSLSQHWSLKAA